MIEISLPAFILTIAVFIALVGYLNAKLYQPLLSFMDAREAAIKRDEDMANQNLADVNSEAKEIEDILNTARNEAIAIREAGLSEIEKDANEKLKAKTDSLESGFVKFLNELESEKDELKSSLRAKLPDIKVSIKDRLARI